MKTFKWYAGQSLILARITLGPCHVPPVDWPPVTLVPLVRESGGPTEKWAIPSLSLRVRLCLATLATVGPDTTTDPAPCNWEPARACAEARWASVCSVQLCRALSVLRNTAIAPWSCCLHRHSAHPSQSNFPLQTSEASVDSERLPCEPLLARLASCHALTTNLIK